MGGQAQLNPDPTSVQVPPAKQGLGLHGIARVGNVRRGRTVKVEIKVHTSRKENFYRLWALTENGILAVELGVFYI